MILADVMAQQPETWVIVCALFGLLVGSFLNVVILRLPALLEYHWRSQCAELNGAATPPSGAPPGLIHPRSRCPNCQHPIGAMENIPVISYVVLRGRCRQCKNPISLRYPLIEAVTSLLSAAVAWHFGFSVDAAGALALTWILVTLAMIDWDHQLLPDNITLPGLWGGLLFSLFGGLSDPVSSLIGAMAGYLALWSVYHGFRLLTGKEGMGYGDFKLLAMIGAWLGWQALPATVLLSSLVGAVLGIALIVSRRHQQDQPMPFGPYLAIAGWIMLIWGEQINSQYLNLAGMH